MHNKINNMDTIAISALVSQVWSATGGTSRKLGQGLGPLWFASIGVSLSAMGRWPQDWTLSSHHPPLLRTGMINRPHLRRLCQVCDNAHFIYSGRVALYLAIRSKRTSKLALVTAVTLFPVCSVGNSCRPWQLTELRSQEQLWENIGTV